MRLLASLYTDCKVVSPKHSVVAAMIEMMIMYFSKVESYFH